MMKRSFWIGSPGEITLPAKDKHRHLYWQTEPVSAAEMPVSQSVNGIVVLGICLCLLLLMWKFHHLSAITYLFYHYNSSASIHNLQETIRKTCYLESTASSMSFRWSRNGSDVSRNSSELQMGCEIDRIRSQSVTENKALSWLSCITLVVQLTPRKGKKSWQ